MKRSGTRSAADKASARYQLTLKPPRRLTAKEKAVWDAVMLSGDRWTVADAYLIAMYANAVVAYDDAQSPNDREKAGRLALSIATRLRLTPQSRYDNRAAARTADRALDMVAGADDPLLGGSAWTQN